MDTLVMRGIYLANQTANLNKISANLRSTAHATRQRILLSGGAIQALEQTPLALRSAQSLIQLRVQVAGQPAHINARCERIQKISCQMTPLMHIHAHAQNQIKTKHEFTIYVLACFYQLADHYHAQA